jgi:predicted RNA-binding protein YlxR (DUF448 family)
MRTCIGCRTTLPQASMVRCALTSEGDAIISRTAAGRGAWLCSSACFALAVKKRGFERAWRRPFGAGALATLARTLETTTLDMRDLSSAGGFSGDTTPTKG